MTFTVASTLDAHIERTEKPRLPDGKWHPSSLFACERQSVYAVRGIEKSDPHDARSGRIFKIGHALHEIVQRALTEDANAVAVYNEVEIAIPEFGVVGAADSLLEFRTALPTVPTEYVADYELVELKSINTNAFRYLKGPKPEHEAQARTYAMALRRHGGMVENVGDEDYMCPNCQTPWKCNGPHIPEPSHRSLPPLGDALSRIRIVYFDKNELKIEEFPLDVSVEWEQEFEGRMSRLEEYRQDGTALPPRLYDDKGNQPKWPCAYCSWRTQCWEVDPEGEVL